MKKNIIFVCNGNIHRSVIAAECLKNILKEQKLDSKWLVDSYGIQGTMGTGLPGGKQLSNYTNEWNAAKLSLQKLNIDISDHFFQVISMDVMERADVIIAMDNEVYIKAKNSLVKQFPNQKNKICCFSEFTPYHKIIKDPSGSDSVKTHEKVIKTIYYTLNKRFEDILNCTKNIS